jgi:hypothetical protein
MHKSSRVWFRDRNHSEHSEHGSHDLDKTDASPVLYLSMGLIKHPQLSAFMYASTQRLVTTIRNKINTNAVNTKSLHLQLGDR